MRNLLISLVLLTLLALLTGGCASQPSAQAQAEYDADFTLTTRMEPGKMVFAGVGGDIDGIANPDLIVPPGSTIHLTLINGDGMPHDLTFPDLSIHTAMAMAKGDAVDVVFEAGDPGEFVYFCTVSGHRQAGMEGRLVVTEP